MGGGGEGWLAVPDIKRYYKAIVLTGMMAWTNIKSEKSWVKIENALSGEQLHTNMWVSPKYRLLGVNIHKLMNDVFRICDLFHRQVKWKYNSPLIPLDGTKFFSPGNRAQFGKWIYNDQLKDIITKGKYKHISS